MKITWHINGEYSAWKVETQSWIWYMTDEELKNKIWLRL